VWTTDADLEEISLSLKRCCGFDYGRLVDESKEKQKEEQDEHMVVCRYGDRAVQKRQLPLWAQH
jgi:hypothetical protein